MQEKETRADKEKKVKGRKAVTTHIEMIISFSIFFFFLIFLFAYLNPVRQEYLSDVLLGIVERGLREDAEITLVEVFLTVKPALTTNCFIVENPFSPGVQEGDIMVKNSDGEIINFIKTDNNLSIESSGDIYYIYYAEEDVLSKNDLAGLEPCESLSKENYTFSVPKQKKLFSFTKLDGIKNNYAGDYVQLKQQFNFPINQEFIVLIPEIDINMTIKRPLAMIKAKEIPIRVLKEGSIVNAFMRIQVW